MSSSWHQFELLLAASAETVDAEFSVGFRFNGEHASCYWKISAEFFSWHWSHTSLLKLTISRESVEIDHLDKRMMHFELVAWQLIKCDLNNAKFMDWPHSPSGLLSGPLVSHQATNACIISINMFRRMDEFNQTVKCSHFGWWNPDPQFSWAAELLALFKDKMLFRVGIMVAQMRQMSTIIKNCVKHLATRTCHWRNTCSPGQTGHCGGFQVLLTFLETQFLRFG